MKITYDPTKEKKLISLRKKANIGCGKCPNCGEGRISEWIPGFGYSNDGIRVTNYVCVGQNKTDESIKICIDKYSCGNCKTRWESEQYEYYLDDNKENLNIRSPVCPYCGEMRYSGTGFVTYGITVIPWLTKYVNGVPRYCIRYDCNTCKYSWYSEEIDYVVLKRKMRGVEDENNIY